jgi:hypothetical protein
MDELPPGTRSAQRFFASASEPQNPKILAAMADPNARNLCMCCLEKFDPTTAMPRTIYERGQLRTHLKMPDQGYELPVCDNCWDTMTRWGTGMAGSLTCNKDPEIIPNPMLRKLAEGS